MSCCGPLNHVILSIRKIGFAKPSRSYCAVCLAKNTGLWINLIRKGINPYVSYRLKTLGSLVKFVVCTQWEVQNARLFLIWCYNHTIQTHSHQIGKYVLDVWTLWCPLRCLQEYNLKRNWVSVNRIFRCSKPKSILNVLLLTLLVIFCLENVSQLEESLCNDLIDLVNFLIINLFFR